MDIEKPKIQAAYHKRKHLRFSEVEQFDAIIQSARKKPIIPVEQAMPCITQVSIPTARTPTQEVAVSSAGRRDPSALSEKRHTLTQRQRQIEASESRRCILHTGRDHSHEDHVADRSYHLWQDSNLVHTLVPISKAIENSGSKDCRTPASVE